ncbi:hypothetical protein ACOTVF_08565 [Campylobacter jejuni]|uniref:hypothetical protein n=1 Tax=Campylobacter jejuni TaxID=197 RepID=UPI003BA0B31D
MELKNIKDKIKHAINSWHFDLVESLYSQNIFIYQDLVKPYFNFLYQTGQLHTICHYIDLGIGIDCDEAKVINIYKKEIAEDIFDIDYLDKLNENIRVNYQLNLHIKYRTLNNVFVYEKFMLLNDILSKMYFVQKSIAYFQQNKIDEKIRFFDYHFLAKMPFYDFIFSQRNTIGGRIYQEIYTQNMTEIISMKVDTNFKESKIAVFLYGSLRGDWKSQLDNIMKNIVEPLNADCFIHIWDNVVLFPSIQTGVFEWTYRLLTKELDDLAPNIIRDKRLLCKYFPNVYNKLSREYYINLKGKDIKDIKQKYTNIKRIMISNQHFLSFKFRAGYWLYYHNYQALKAIDEYEKVYKIKYDTIISSRVDGDCSTNQQFIKRVRETQLNCIVDLYGQGTGCVFGDSISMKKYFNIYPFAMLENHYNLSWNNHFLIDYYLKLNGIKTDKISFINIIGNTIALKGLSIPDIYQELKEDLRYLNCSEQEIDQIYMFFKRVYQNYNTIPKRTRFIHRHSIEQLSHINLKTELINSVEMQLGMILINGSKHFLSYFSMFYKLYRLIIEHKKKILEYNKAVKLDSRLKCYDQKALENSIEIQKIKNYLSYKLGKSLIEAVNGDNIHFYYFKKLGVIKFFFYDIWIVRREFLKNKEKNR